MAGISGILGVAAAGAAGAVGAVGDVGAERGPSTVESISNTIAKLEKQRDEFKNAKAVTGSAGMDKRINSLENRISNLEKRLEKLKDKEDNGECQTCKNRKYQDESDDPGVSFKSASKIAKGAVGAAVRGHEQEHVVRERAKAERGGREVVSQSVVIKTAICPECGESYVAGGETTTVTRAKVDPTGNIEENHTAPLDGSGEADKNDGSEKTDARFEVGMYDRQSEKGRFFDVTV